MVNKASVHRVTLRQSATMNIRYNVNKLTISQIHQKFPMFSLSTVFRHATQASDNLTEKKKKRTGRPRKVTDRDKRELSRVLKKLRKTDGSLTSKKIQVEAGLTHISNRTVRAILNKHGFRYLQSRHEGLLSNEDLKRRLKFACNTLKNYPENVWRKQVWFYTQNKSFQSG